MSSITQGNLGVLAALVATSVGCSVSDANLQMAQTVGGTTNTAGATAHTGGKVNAAVSFRAANNGNTLPRVAINNAHTLGRNQLTAQ